MVQNQQEFKKVIQKSIDDSAKELRDLSLFIHSNPELAYKECKAHHLLTEFLERKGFKVTKSAFGLETAFLAEYGPEPSEKDQNQIFTVGFLSEYDALPEIGHACGHNLIAIVGVGAALGFKAAIDAGFKAKLKLFGTPAEEQRGGKIDMIEAGAFKNVDVALMAHPGNINCVYAHYLALQQVNVEYFGKAAHASASPWDGVNALDAVVSAYQSISNLRQQMLPTNRVHGIIRKGGDAPNIIPAHTSAEYFIRATKVSELKKLKPRVINCFEAAAKATGCESKLTENPMFYDVKFNECLSRVYVKHMESLGETFPSRQEQESLSRGSTDMGNVTYEVPGIHPVFNIGIQADIHTISFRDAAAQEQPHIRALEVMKGLALTALDASADPQLMKEIKKEFQESERH